MRKLFVSLALALAVVAAACAEDEPAVEATTPEAEGTETVAPSPAADACAKENLTLVEPGVLRIGTDSPAYYPYFIDNDPTNGQGFESAVGYAVAEELGFSREEVRWVVVPFNKSYAPGPKDFDFDINQISITAKRDRAVDFSDPYYTGNQALIALKDSPIADAASIGDLKDAKLGAQVGTTSLAYIQETIQPDQQPFVYDTTNDAKSALEAGQIDGIVVDLPTAFYITAVEIPKAKIVGQFEAATGGTTDEWGLLFEEGNPLRECVNRALEALRAEGTLDSIQQEWLSNQADAPVLT